MKSFTLVLVIIVASLVTLTGLGIVSRGCSMVDEAAAVVQEQAGARTLVRRYEWFKDAAGQLQGLAANVDASRARQTSMELSYAGVARQQWSREDREQWNQWDTEASGIAMSYNALAAEYNANASKLNWNLVPLGYQNLPRTFVQYK